MALLDVVENISHFIKNYHHGTWYLSTLGHRSLVHAIRSKRQRAILELTFGRLEGELTIMEYMNLFVEQKKIKKGKYRILMYAGCGLAVLTTLLILLSTLFLMVNSPGAYFKFSLPAVGKALLMYKESFGEFPENLDILVENEPKIKEMVYFGYGVPLPQKYRKILYNNTPVADDSNPLSEIVLAAPCQVSGTRSVLTLSNIQNHEMLQKISEIEFQKYWIINSERKLVPRNPLLNAK